MIQLYSRKHCYSSEKAKQWLIEHKLPFEENNIKELHKVQIIEMLARTENGVEDLLCVRSKTYKELNLDFSTLKMNELLDALKKYPLLLKGPIILNDKYIQVGFNIEDIRTFLPREIRTIHLHFRHEN